MGDNLTDVIEMCFLFNFKVQFKKLANFMLIELTDHNDEKIRCSQAIRRDRFRDIDEVKKAVNWIIEYLEQQHPNR